jgi:hypothetical protein
MPCILWGIYVLYERDEQRPSIQDVSIPFSRTIENDGTDAIALPKLEDIDVDRDILDELHTSKEEMTARYPLPLLVGRAT